MHPNHQRLLETSGRSCLILIQDPLSQLAATAPTHTIPLMRHTPIKEPHVSVYSRILALVDSSSLRFKVAERALSIASLNNSALRIGHVADASPYVNAGIDLVAVSDNLRKGLERDFEEMMEEAKEGATIPSIDVEIVTGYMPHALHQQLIYPFQPDLVICGIRELSDLSYLISGSTSTHLIRTVKCDVLVVKGGNEDCYDNRYDHVNSNR